MSIYVHFVQADQSIMMDGYKGVVTNPDVFITSNQEFMEGVTQLVSYCNREGHDLRIFSIVFDNGEAWQMCSSDSEREYKDPKSIIETVNRMLTRLMIGSDPKYDPDREFIRNNNIDLSKLL